MTPREYLEIAEQVTEERGDFSKFLSVYNTARGVFDIEESVVVALYKLYGKESYQILFGEE